MAADLRWEKARKIGRFKYSAIQALGFALLCSLIMIAWNAYDGNEFSWQQTAFMMFWNFVFMGMIQYFFLWALNEKRYHNRMQSRL